MVFAMAKRKYVKRKRAPRRRVRRRVMRRGRVSKRRKLTGRQTTLREAWRKSVKEWSKPMLPSLDVVRAASRSSALATARRRRGPPGSNKLDEGTGGYS